ncbi:uncharacterized protein K452DRAFT_318267 [Aplosporella prunicola CBS 121167]|uniref:Delta(24(24(1)))-sterol reductase n=1 Tax=Aplosporella prunicola CBS 121167 TaxID=1176127 RepID=A0A6A6BF96_9PEZI|nr:uncharacterized protein K452DRAFT_318267 [Aplosporella prunicola CBS 121167]KAF2141914.1 hypothetical protein K452DRAFT_318267 [Aplosporella prunicola CBS 121167]
MSASSEKRARKPQLQTQPLPPKQADHGKDSDSRAEYEFCGPLGVSAMIIGFPLLMWYMYVGAICYNGRLPLPAEDQSLPDFVRGVAGLAYTHAYPHRRAWVIYWTFLVFEALGYMFLPGVYGKGKLLPHLGKQLDYYCSGIWSWYLTIAGALVLHFSGLFRLDTLINEFGPLMSVAIISGFLVAIVGYVSAFARGVQHRMTGNHVYDFFMGAELNPRLFSWLDFKMFQEVRIPWYMLFLLSLGAALKQYNELGYVSGEVCFILMAHFLYGNACAKGEELIITSWDIYYEKWGFLLIFWNLAGVPLTYCHCTIYLATHHPSEYHWSRGSLALLFTTYLFAYWVWDTANSQKNMFRAIERGSELNRKTFPQLPWKFVKDPKVVHTDTGDNILCDGWYGMARKVHYTCDWFFAFSWGLITGFNSPFPWFYSAFFTVMIIHRARRDIRRCRKRYGAAWEKYERQVPYLFIPYVF